MNSHDKSQDQYDQRCNFYRERVINARRRLQELDKNTTPALYAMMTTRGDMRGKLASLMDYISSIQRYADIDAHDNAWAAIDMRRLVTLYGGGLDTWERYLALLAAWGLLLKRKPRPTNASATAEKALLQRASEKKYGLSAAYFNPMMRYSIPEYSKYQIMQAERMAKHWIDSGYSMRGMSKTAIISAYGQNVANRAYKDIRKISPKQMVIAASFEDTLTAKLNSYGYTTLADLAAAVAESTGYSTKRILNVWGRIKGDLMERYSLAYRRPTKEEVIRFQLSGLGWILIQDK
jgi:hypothetical protein